MSKSNAFHVTLRSSILTGLFVTLLLCTGSIAQAQDRGNPNWYTKVVPYFWLSNVDGKQVLGDFRLSVADSVLLPAVALRFETGKGRLRGLVHLFRSHRKSTTTITGFSSPADSTEANYAFTWITADLLGAVQIGPFSTAHAVELYAGGRFVRHEQNLEFTDNLTAAASTTESWIDPVVGTRLYIELSRHFWTTISTDIAGFGVGSELTWSREGELGFRVTKFADLTIRYTHLQVQFANRDDGPDHYEWDEGAIQGWLIGAVLKL